MKRTGLIFVSILTAGLFACGGGGDGSSNPPPDDNPPPATELSITADNAEQISAVVLNSVNLLEGVNSVENVLVGVSVTVDDGGFRYDDFVVDQLVHFAHVLQQQPPAGVAGVVVGPVTEPCNGGGEVTLSGNIADINTYTAGDTLSADFNSCNQDGTLISGEMDFTINSVSDGFTGVPPYEIDVTLTLTDFSVDDGDTSFGSNGDMRLVESDDGAGGISTEFSGNSLTTTMDNVSQALADYHYVVEVDVPSGDYSAEIAGTIASSLFDGDGTVSFVTVTPFTGNENIGTGDPTAGELLMTSDSDDSQARLTIQPDGFTVFIDIDNDGDGVFEELIETDWETLMALS